MTDESLREMMPVEKVGCEATRVLFWGLLHARLVAAQKGGRTPRRVYAIGEETRRHQRVAFRLLSLLSWVCNQPKSTILQPTEGGMMKKGT